MFQIKSQNLIWFKKFKENFLLFCIFLAIIFVWTLRPISDPDSGFHLLTGKYIFLTGQVPLYDVFSYTAFGARLIAHYWFSDFLFYLCYRALGYWGPIILVALLAVLTYSLLIAVIRIYLPNYTLALLGALSFSFLTTWVWNFWVVRPQVFGYLFLACLIFVLEKWRLSRNKKWLYFLPLIFLFWANMHASVVLGTGVALVYAGIFLFRNLNEIKTYLFELLFIIFSFLLVLVNPNGYKIITYGFYISNVVKELGIFEWQSIIFYLPGSKALVEFLFILFVGFFLIFLILRNYFRNKLEEVNWEWLILSVIAMVLPILSTRHVGFFAILTFPFFVILFENFLNQNKAYVEVFQNKRSLPTILGLAIFVVSVFYIFPLSPINSNILPVGAAEFIYKNKTAGPIFNNLGDGGFLAWILWPDYKIFFDGRSEVYLGVPTKDYQTIIKIQQGWEDLFDNKYKINTAILSSAVPMKKGDLIRTDLVLAKKLVDEKKFKLVYWDDVSVVLVRDIPENKKVIDQYGYKIIGPYNAPQYILAKDAKEAALEIERAIKISPTSKTIARYAREFLATH